MKLIDKVITLDSQGDVYSLFPIGDVHMGAKNCAESHLKRYVEHIKNTPNSLRVGGGDYCECITPSDTRRFDSRSLPDWIFDGKASSIKDKLNDLSLQQRKRFEEIVDPIKDKCLGLIEGNHEFSIMKHSNNAHHYVMCDNLKTPHLTDASFIRLRFQRTNNSGGHAGSSVTIAIVHGTGGGRSAGSEPNHLAKLSTFFDADIILRGHAHLFNIAPPQPFLYVPHRGTMPDELMERYVHKANWGCWVKTWAEGESTYDSRACYPARPLQAMEIKIKPFNQKRVKICGKSTSRDYRKISIRECDYE